MTSERRKTFDALYRRDPDPWAMATSAYEAQKYAATLAALPTPRYRAGLEVGASIGILTEGLATRCEALLALDVSDVALATARERVRVPHVRFERAEVPGDWPAGSFDLIVLSEILYFLEPAEVDQVAALSAASLAGTGDVLLVNYLGPNDRPLDGERAANRFIEAAATAGLAVVAGHRERLYRIDRLRLLG